MLIKKLKLMGYHYMAFGLSEESPDLSKKCCKGTKLKDTEVNVWIHI